MQFKQPEVLYALFLLIIPFIIHLFRLRKFQKIPFTNVQFLKKINSDSRKSKRLKEWLVLAARTMALAFVILAFAQPFLTDKTISERTEKTLIYLDNSFSMQAKGEKGTLLKRAVHDILENLPPDKEISLFTNDTQWEDTKLSALDNELREMDFSAMTTTLKDILVKGERFLKNADSKNFIIISDFQDVKNELSELKPYPMTNYSFVQLHVVKPGNLAVDSLAVTDIQTDKIQLRVFLKNYGASEKNIPVSLYINDSLFAKSALSVAQNKDAATSFSIPLKKNFSGKIVIKDLKLPFDNAFYFTVRQNDKIKVLAINGVDDRFLRKIYTPETFSYTATSLSKMDYNTLSEQNLIILNELPKIPSALIPMLYEYLKKGGSLALIPGQHTDVVSYGDFFKKLRLGTVENKRNKALKVTKIHFSNPLLKHVFERKLTNFRYPEVKQFYPAQLDRFSAVLSFENQQAFIARRSIGNGIFYWVSAPLNTENSNFTKNPLVVPVFYNFGAHSFGIPRLYYTIGVTNDIVVETPFVKNRIFSIKGNGMAFTPGQKAFRGKVVLTTEYIPKKAGTYTIFEEDKPLSAVSYNYSGVESALNYGDVAAFSRRFDNVAYYDSPEPFFSKTNKQKQDRGLWKGCVIFTLLFLTMEILIIKLL